MKTITQHFQRRQRGAAAVEFAIVISLLVLIIGGIFEFGRMLWYYDALAKATRDGARYLSTSAPLPLDTSNAGNAKVLVVHAATQAGLPTFGPGNVSITCNDGSACPTDPATTPEYVTVSVSYNLAFGSWFPLPLPMGPLALTPHTTMPYMCKAGATTPC